MAIEYYSPVDGGAIGRVIREQSLLMEQRGHHVTILTVPSPSGEYDTGTVLHCKIGRRENLPLPTRAIFKLKHRWLRWDLPYYDIFIKSVIEHISRMTVQPDVILTHNDVVAPRYLNSRFPQSIIAVMLHNIQHPSMKDPEALAAPVDIFLTVSDFLRDWAISHLGLPSEKVATVANGVNLEQFFPPPDWPARPSGALRVLVVGRVEPRKGQDVVARAVSQLAREGLEVSLTVAGPVWMFGAQALETSPYLEEVLAKARPAPCQYLGHVPHDRIPALYRQHDVNCLISRFEEGFPLAALEAMACGCALISSERGGLKEATAGAALVVDPEKPETVVGALRRLATDEEELREWKKRALERAREASWVKSVDRLLRIFEKLHTDRLDKEACVA